MTKFLLAGIGALALVAAQPAVAADMPVKAPIVKAPIVDPWSWNNFYIEDYVSQAFGFQAQVASLITEGVFMKYPTLKVVLIESGVSWAPAFLWRLTKFWRGMRSEVPWVDRAPWEIFRDHIRMTITPLDAPETAETVAKIADHLHSDEILLYSSDYPHWQFDGDSVLPSGLSEGLRRKIMVDNPLATYPRCREASV